MSEEEDFPTFPANIPILRVKKTEVFDLEVGDFQSESEMQKLISRMFDRPEARFHYYEPKGGPENQYLHSAIDSREILVDQVEFSYYRHPIYARDYVHVVSDEYDEYDFDWEREVVEKGPEFLRMELKLSDRKRREFTTDESLEKQRQMDDTPIELKPGLFGFSIDLLKLPRWLSKKYNGIGKRFRA